MKVQEGFNMAGKPNKKYSAEFKKEAVEKYLRGEIGGLITACRAAQTGLKILT